MLRKFCILGVSLFAATAVVQAQQAPSGTAPANAPAEAKAPSDPSQAMEDPQPGDHWTYELRDDITGNVKSTLVHTVTDVTATDISVRMNVMGNPNTSYLTFDRAWNMTNSGTWRYTPGDGSGIKTPLAVGKTWPVKATEVRTSPSLTFKRSGSAKVVGQESLTTRAGTFDTFKIEASLEDQNSNDPTKKMKMTVQTWYAPAIDHWVKRIWENRQDGRLRDKSTMELVAYGRR